MNCSGDDEKTSNKGKTEAREAQVKEQGVDQNWGGGGRGTEKQLHLAGNKGWYGALRMRKRLLHLSGYCRRTEFQVSLLSWQIPKLAASRDDLGYSAFHRPARSLAARP